MKKIIFDDRYGLTDAVLRGRKTMTRRIIKDHDDPTVFAGSLLCIDKAAYKIGEEVAVAQSYRSIHEDMMNGDYGDGIYDAFRWAVVDDKPGWNNKMFTLPMLMPHRIRITNINVERLQDISEEDVYREGFEKQSVNNGWGNAAWHWEAMLTYMDRLGLYKDIRSRNPQEAFSVLIDKVSGTGTWDKNPWVFAYEFELIC